MAISNDEMLAAVNASFTDVNEFGAMLKLLAGVGARVKLEVQRDAAQRAVSELHQAMQAAREKKQSEVTQSDAEFNAQIAAKQQEAAQLQAAIDVLNAQLPDLLQ